MDTEQRRERETKLEIKTEKDNENVIKETP